ncbi:anti-anti-sigma factor, partial [Roseovarius sp. HI0049]
MELDSSSLNNVQVISVKAERIDAAGAIRFKDAVRAAVDKEAPRVVLDLGRVRFVDSSGLGAVVAVMKFLGPERKLELAALTPDVDKVFRLT